MSADQLSPPSALSPPRGSISVSGRRPSDSGSASASASASPASPAPSAGPSHAPKMSISTNASLNSFYGLPSNRPPGGPDPIADDPDEPDDLSLNAGDEADQLPRSDSNIPPPTDLKAFMSRFSEFHTDLSRDPTRRLLKEGLLGRQAKFKVVDRLVFLFTDLFLVSDYSSKDSGKLIQKQTLDLSTVVVQDFASQSAGKKKSLSAKELNSFAILSPERDFQFIAKNPAEKLEWINAIQSAAAAHKIRIHEVKSDQPAIKADQRLLSATLHSAVKEGSEDVLLHLLSERNEDPNMKDPHGDAPLHLAVKSSQHGAVSVLIAFGARVDETDAFGRTALHLAALQADYGICMILASKGADLSIVGQDGNTPLAALCMARARNLAAENESMARQLAGEEPSPIDPTADSADSSDDSTGQSLVDLIHFFIDRGADPDQVDAQGEPLIYRLAHMGKYFAVKALIEKFAHFSSVDHRGFSCLHFAVLGSAGLPIDFEPSGALQPPQTRKSDKEMQEYVNLAQLLLARGLPPNGRDHCLNTPLTYARSVSLAAALVLGGARIDLKNEAGVKAIEYFETLRDSSERESALVVIKGARKAFESRSEVEGDEKFSDEKSWVPNDGNDPCQLCLAEFRLTVREHHCRRCGALVCGACSSNQFTARGKSHRVCDCCFNELLARAAAVALARRIARNEKLKAEAELAKEREKVKEMQKKTKEERDADTFAQIAEAKEKRAKELEKEGKTPDRDNKRNSTIQSTNAVMAENKNLLLNRGQKLNELEQRAAKLEDDAQNFYSLAQKIKEKKKKEAESWF